ncbi:neutral zinc metallopeptidase [Roseomonas sp. 18066]|uniref:KPN_02809 family neutral zinc metallopeptidase n=1 Tax=Roseomonas sp. 18066 TaxID=2681412 RepID=UPI001358A4EF|nr:neutral zinc metallopeptidase [Roseomonas sp. 18066]
MRLGGPESDNIEDRRGRGGGGGGRGGIAVGGLGGVAILLVCLFFGIDPSVLLSDGEAPPPTQREASREPGRDPGQRNAAPEDAGRRFVAQVLGETEQVWTAQFTAMGRQYQAPVLVLFSGATQSGCGGAQAQMGPFYCPNDRRVYIDLDFMAQLQQQLGARGDFAAAYIVAHEVGHHVQNELGVLRRAEELRRGNDANAVQVRVELQADCFAGLWAKRANDARRILEPGDVEEGLAAAAAVGDDRLQRRAGGRVQPESFTHGSSAERVRWFRRGLESGALSACDTFASR